MPSAEFSPDLDRIADLTEGPNRADIVASAAISFSIEMLHLRDQSEVGVGEASSARGSWAFTWPCMR
jgi:hypothetical protein